MLARELLGERLLPARRASRRGLAVVYPDTSPRGLGHPGETDSWDFGVGAGFYVNATQEPWANGFRMEDYVVKELPDTLFGDAEFGKYLDGSACPSPATAWAATAR